MPQNFIRGDGPDQVYLLPPDVRDWLPRQHLAWELTGLAQDMDLGVFTSWYRADGQGRPAYHPAVMVPLVCYCFCKGIRSSRGIEAATFDDVGARVICGNLHPDHSTVHRFVTRHEQPVKDLLTASVVACARQGLVRVDVVAGDGTKVKANASAAGLQRHAPRGLSCGTGNSQGTRNNSKHAPETPRASTSATGRESSNPWHRGRTPRQRGRSLVWAETTVERAAYAR